MKVNIYKRFERFWHWGQAILVIMLVFTGLEVHGKFFSLFGYDQAVELHRDFAWALLILIIFAIFWHFTTGEWRQYIPSGKNVREYIRYYLSGIFKGEMHPTKKTELSKLNPLQKITYFLLKVFLFPVQVGSGLLYMYYNDLSLDLETIATIHVIGTYLFLVFLIMHLYLTTTGHTLTSNIKAMITGWEDLEHDKK